MAVTRLISLWKNSVDEPYVLWRGPSLLICASCSSVVLFFSKVDRAARRFARRLARPGLLPPSRLSRHVLVQLQPRLSWSARTNAERVPLQRRNLVHPRQHSIGLGDRECPRPRGPPDTRKVTIGRPFGPRAIARGWMRRSPGEAVALDDLDQCSTERRRAGPLGQAIGVARLAETTVSVCVARWRGGPRTARSPPRRGGTRNYWPSRQRPTRRAHQL